MVAKKGKVFEKNSGALVFCLPCTGMIFIFSYILA